MKLIDSFNIDIYLP